MKSVDCVLMNGGVVLQTAHQECSEMKIHTLLYQKIMVTNLKHVLSKLLNARTLILMMVAVIVWLLYAISQFGYVQNRLFGTRFVSNIRVNELQTFVKINSFYEKSNISSTANLIVTNNTANNRRTQESNVFENTIEIPDITVMNESQVYSMAESESNLALNYWSKLNNWQISGVWGEHNRMACETPFPAPETIRFNNIYWQQYIVDRDNLTIFLYNAYYDNREAVPKVKTIAVTANQNAINNLKLWCLLWFDNYKKPLLSNVSLIYPFWPNYWVWGRETGIYFPLFLACDIPTVVKHLVPKAISFTKTSTCDSDEPLTHNVRVNYAKPTVRHQFGVCVQALRFASVDYSVRLVEWLEMLKILGAHKVFLYKFGAHPNMVKVLDYYKLKDFVDWRPLTLPDVQPNSPHLYQWYFDRIGGRFWPQETLELNDCLYRNLYNYKYLAIFDVDEIIVPVNAYNWSDLIDQIQNSIADKEVMKTIGYYENINAYVYKNLETREISGSDGKTSIASYLYTMRHVYRNRFTPAGTNIKCFHDVDRVEAVHNHYPLKCLGREGYHNCDGHVISTNHSFMLHFKTEILSPDQCNHTDLKRCAVYETVLWKYYDRLNANMKAALTRIFS